MLKHRHPPSFSRPSPKITRELPGEASRKDTPYQPSRTETTTLASEQSLLVSSGEASRAADASTADTASSSSKPNLSTKSEQDKGRGTETRRSSEREPNAPQSSGNGALQRSAAITSDGRRYRLEVIQHPERTAELVGVAVLSRIPLSPPLVAQVTIEDQVGSSASLHGDMPFLAAHLWLYDEEGNAPVDLAEGPPSPGGSMLPQRLLYGTLVSSLHHFKDLQGHPAMYFIFPDVSVRQRGRFRLMVNMMRLTSPTGSFMVMPEGERNLTLASVLTDPFEVVGQSEFTAPVATTLTNSLHRQGARMY